MEAAKRQYLGHDARRAQILGVATRLFSDHGYDAVSLTQIAQAAGIARGLVNHYFGDKRGLYVEVVRAMLTIPDDLFVAPEGDEERRAALSTAVDRWLRSMKASRGIWLGNAGAQGPARDPDIEAVVAETRAQIADRIIALAWGPPAEAPRELRALILGYGGFAEAITAEWLDGRMTRAAAHKTLLEGLVALVDHALPEIERQRS